MKNLFAALALGLALLVAPACSSAPDEPAGEGPAAVSLRDAARIGVWRLVASFEAALDEAATCAEAGLLPPEVTVRVAELGAAGRDAVELVRLGVTLSEAVLPAGVAAEPVAEAAASSGQVGAALLALDEVLRVTQCAGAVRVALDGVAEQAAARFATGARPPVIAFDDAAFQVDGHLTRLSAVRASSP